ncbi:MAG: CsbD family protein [Actinomycetota bacterium]|nr:CsbD family protein [Actinomycetota bacterium]
MTDHKTDEFKGRAKEAAGAVTDDKDLKNEGKADQASASVKEKVENAVDSIKNKVTRKD